MLLELIEELQMAVKFDEAIAEIKQLELRCYYLEDKYKDIPCSNDDDLCDACKVRRIIRDL